MTLPDDPIERGGYWIFSLPTSHPFQPAFVLHDRAYKAKELGTLKASRKTVDKALLKNMLMIAKERKSLRLKAEAYLYYRIARAFGGFVW
jgi:hypothetical protein